MRRPLSLLLLILLALYAHPAAAKGGAPSVRGVHVQVARAPVLPLLPSVRAVHEQAHRAHVPALYPPWEWGPWGLDWADYLAIPPAETPGILIVPNLAPPPVMRPAATVETTAQGVTVIRGPGSHHLAR